MTRIAGTNIIKAYCCGALYSTPAFASINFMAGKHWTDGANENSLSQSGGGLRRCTCGGYFLSGYAERVGFIPKNNTQPQEQSEHSISKIFRNFSKLLIAENKAKLQTIRKPASQWATNETIIPPKSQSVTGAAIAELNDSKPQNKILLIQARRLYWGHLTASFVISTGFTEKSTKIALQNTHSARHRWTIWNSLLHCLKAMIWSMSLSLESYTAN